MNMPEDKKIIYFEFNAYRNRYIAWLDGETSFASEFYKDDAIAKVIENFSLDKSMVEIVEAKK